HWEVRVGDGEEAGMLGVAGFAGERLDHRREVGARVGEDVVDAAFAEPGQIGFRGHFGRHFALWRFAGHDRCSLVPAGGDTSDRPTSVNEASSRGWGADLAALGRDDAL